MPRLRSWFLLIPAAFLGVFYFYPLSAILKKALCDVNQDWQALPWARIGNILSFTIFQAGLSTALTILIGLPLAYFFGTYAFRGKNTIRLLTTLPFILPTVVVAVAFNSIIGPKGVLNLILMQAFHLSQPPLQIMNTLSAILLAHVFYNSAVIIRMVSSAIEQLDPHLDQVSRVLGASPCDNFRKVIFPLIKPSLGSAALVVFLFDFTSFGVILMMGGARLITLEVEIYFQTMQLLNLPLAAWLSVIQLFCTILMIILILSGGGGLPVPVKPRISHTVYRRVRYWWERVYFWLVLAVMLILFAAPLLSLTLRSFFDLQSAGDISSAGLRFTLNFYRELFMNRQQSLFYVPPAIALRNSMVYALAASAFALFFGSLACFALMSKNLWGKILNPLLMLPMGTSAVTLGLGFLITFASLPNARLAFPLLIPIAHSLVALPFVVRTIQPALASIPDTLRQAGAILGASPWKVWSKVELPLISRAMVVAALFSFAISLGEFGATAFFSRPDLPTLPVAIFRFLGQPGALNYGQAMAMATILMLVCALVMMLVDKLSGTNS